MIDKETHLYTDSINYDVNNRIARYNDRGRITNEKNTLTSIIGVFFVAENLFHFKDSVKIVNPEYVMKADTMDYNTVSEIAYFNGPTTLNGDSLYIYCERGWYDTKNKVTSVWKNAMIDNRKQIVHGDSLFFNDSTGFGQSFRNVIIEDTVNKIAVEGNYAWYYKQPERFKVTDRAVFIQISDKDSLFLHADTISSVTSNRFCRKISQAYEGILWGAVSSARICRPNAIPFHILFRILLSGFTKFRYYGQQMISSHLTQWLYLQKIVRLTGWNYITMHLLPAR